MPTNDEIIQQCLSGDVRTAQQNFNQQLMTRVNHHINQRREEVAQSMFSRTTN